MPVKIRLSRIGRKHVPFYRVIAVDSRRKRDGASLDIIGTYDALNSKIVGFKESVYQDWLSRGAIATRSVEKIYRLFKKNDREKTNAAPEQAAAKPVKKAPVASVVKDETTE